MSVRPEYLLEQREALRIREQIIKYEQWAERLKIKMATGGPSADLDDMRRRRSVLLSRSGKLRARLLGTGLVVPGHL